MKKHESTDTSTLEMFEKGTKEIMNQNIPLSLELLKNCEISLEETVNKGLNADGDLILATLHNIALCYQHLNNLEDCAAYLEACIYNIKSKNNPLKSNSSKLKSEKIRRLRYLCLLHIQLCDCLHKLKNYQPAYKNAEKAVKCSVFAVKLCINACFDSKNSKHQTQIAVYSASKHSNFSNLYNETCGILQFLFLLMNGKKLKKNSEENYKKTIFWLQKQSDWIFSLKFDQIFEIKVLLFSDLKTSHSLKAELSKDFIFDKICMAVTSYFLIYRELKWLKQEPLKAKAYIKRSISIAESFFPERSPILNYLAQEYSQKYLKFKKHSEPIRSKSAKEGKNLRTGRKLGTKKNEKNGPLVKSQRNFGLFAGNDSQNEQLKPDAKISLGCPEKTEPEPQLSEESSEDSQVILDQAIKLFSSDLYGDYYEEEPDKYEYMPLKRS